MASKFLFFALKHQLNLIYCTLRMLTFSTAPLNTLPPAAGNPSDVRTPTKSNVTTPVRGQDAHNEATGATITHLTEKTLISFLSPQSVQRTDPAVLFKC